MLYSSSISFMEKDDPRRAVFYLQGPRFICSEKSLPKDIRIENLFFYLFIEDTTIYPYQNHKEIEWLSLDNCHGPMQLPGIISGHRNLKKLRINGLRPIPPDTSKIYLSITDSIGVFSKLESLSFDGVAIKDEDIAKLKLLPNLKHLWIQESGMSGFPMAFTEMKNLEVLVLNLECIDKLPDELKNLKKLKLLNLDATNVSPEEAHRIADQMPALRYLNHTRTPRLPCDGHDGRKKKN